ncbi:hypothetical protein [Streptomyces cremeus]|uniref:Acyltransferase PapA5 n=1 Tax=Streptomyces cremeus TaxID=66881 RepID=A0ABV5PN00_STRCM
MTAAVHPTGRATTPDTYVRRISQIERGYLNAAATGVPQLIQMVVEGEGRIDAGELRKAVRAATLAGPGLAVRRRGATWRADGPPPSVTELPYDAGYDLPFLRGDLDVVTGPVCEVALMTGQAPEPADATAPAPVRLVVRASHVVTDGRGLRQWIADVFRVLRGEEPVGADSLVDDTHFRTAAGRVAPLEPPARRAGLPAALGHGPADGVPLWVRRRVAACPPAVTARVAAALAGVLPCDEGRLIVPVDLRRHDPAVRSSANLTSQLVLDFARDDTWSVLHGRLVRALLRKADVASLERDFLRRNPFANTLAEARGLDGTRFPCTAIVTDHGRIDLDGLSTGRFRPTAFHTLPMLVPYAEMFLSTCRIGDETEVTLSCRDRAGARAAAERVLDAVERALTADA